MRKALAYVVMSIIATIFVVGAVLAVVSGIQAVQAILVSNYLATWTMVLCVATTVISTLAATVLLMAVPVTIVKVMYQDAGYTGSLEQVLLMTTYENTPHWPTKGFRAFWDVTQVGDSITGYADSFTLKAYPRDVIADEIALRRESGEMGLTGFPRLLSTGQLSDALRGGEAVRYTVTGKVIVLRTY